MTTDAFLVAYRAVMTRLLLWELVGPEQNLRVLRSRPATRLGFRERAAVTRWARSRPELLKAGRVGLAAESHEAGAAVLRRDRNDGEGAAPGDEGADRWLSVITL